MAYKNILVVSDNEFLIKSFYGLMQQFGTVKTTYVCSPQNNALLQSQTLPVSITSLNIKQHWQQLNYDLILSLHCKQIFPAELVQKIRCINVHPGLNPHNRGWFPQVFSIMNGLPSGATIHEIDELLDHGAIIAQMPVAIEKWDTSLSAYEKIQQAEVELLKQNLASILDGTCKTFLPAEEGNVNLKKDFNRLCQIDLNKKVTMSEAIDYLRAVTHGTYKNAWFIDPATGKKVFIEVTLTPSV